MASIKDVVAGTRAALGQIVAACAALRAALTRTESARHGYAAHGVGSTQPHLADATAHLQRADDLVQQANVLLAQAQNAGTAFVAGLTGTALPDPGPLPAVRRFDDRLLERLRAELPPTITSADRGTGRKTHGRWVGADGKVHTIISGDDATGRKVQAFFKARGYRGILAVADHVEMKLASELRDAYEQTGQPQHATLVINNVPCGGRFSCGNLLPVMLPEGCTVTVHAPNYRRRLTGGAQP